MKLCGLPKSKIHKQPRKIPQTKNRYKQTLIDQETLKNIIKDVMYVISHTQYTKMTHGFFKPAKAPKGYSDGLHAERIACRHIHCLNCSSKLVYIKKHLYLNSKKTVINSPLNDLGCATCGYRYEIKSYNSSIEGKGVPQLMLDPALAFAILFYHKCELPHYVLFVDVFTNKIQYITTEQFIHLLVVNFEYINECWENICQKYELFDKEEIYIKRKMHFIGLERLYIPVPDEYLNDVNL